MTRALVLTSDGEPLAEASLQVPAGEASAWALLRAPRSEGLLHYYFGLGRRQVVLEDGDGSRWGGLILGTRWQADGRVWYLGPGG